MIIDYIEKILVNKNPLQSIITHKTSVRVEDASSNDNFDATSTLHLS